MPAALTSMTGLYSQFQPVYADLKAVALRRHRSRGAVTGPLGCALDIIAGEARR